MKDINQKLTCNINNIIKNHFKNVDVVKLSVYVENPPKHCCFKTGK